MDTKSAIQAMLDGKKVRIIDWNKECYVLFNGKMFVDEEGEPFSEFTSYGTTWEIYEEPKPKQTVTIEKWLCKNNFDFSFSQVVQTDSIDNLCHCCNYTKVKLIDIYEVKL